MNTTFSLQSFSFAFDQTSPLFFDTTSFAIATPGITFLQGKNGAGKSTFFRLMQGIVEPGQKVQGTIEVRGNRYNLHQGVDLQKLHARSIMLHQSFDRMLAPSFTGFENIQFSQFDTNPSLSLVATLPTVSDLAAEFAIPLDKPVHQLSGGQRQMLAMLMIAQKPLDLLLLDEPTAALDSKNAHFLMKGIEKLICNTGISVICVSHDQEIVAQYAQAIIEIDQTVAGPRILKVAHLS